MLATGMYAAGLTASVLALLLVVARECVRYQDRKRAHAQELGLVRLRDRSDEARLAEDREVAALDAIAELPTRPGRFA